MGRRAERDLTMTKRRKTAKKRTAPCRACKGFSVPARRGATVARNARGQFTKARKGLAKRAW